MMQDPWKLELYLMISTNRVPFFTDGVRHSGSGGCIHCCCCEMYLHLRILNQSTARDGDSPLERTDVVDPSSIMM